MPPHGSKDVRPPEKNHHAQHLNDVLADALKNWQQGDGSNVIIQFEASISPNPGGVSQYPAVSCRRPASRALRPGIRDARNVLGETGCTDPVRYEVRTPGLGLEGVTSAGRAVASAPRTHLHQRGLCSLTCGHSPETRQLTAQGR